MTELRPGWKTTEFYTTLVGILLAALVAMGAITQADAATLGGAAASIIACVGSIVSSLVLIGNYVRGRMELKRQAQAKSLP